MATYPVIDPNNKGGKFIYTVLANSPDVGSSVSKKLGEVIDLFSDDAVNSKKFEKLYNLLKDEKTVYTITNENTAVNWDLIKSYARKDDIDTIYNGISHDVNKLYKYLISKEREELPEL